MKTKLTPDDIKFLMNTIRHESVKWYGRREALDRARKKVFVRRSKKDGKKIYKFYWQCAKCKEWFRDEKQVEVDHIIEIGSYCGDIEKTLLRMLPSVDGLQVLCLVCHLKKTNIYKSARSRWKRKVPR